MFITNRQRSEYLFRVTSAANSFRSMVVRPEYLRKLPWVQNYVWVAKKSGHVEAGVATSCRGGVARGLQTKVPPIRTAAGVSAACFAGVALRTDSSDQIAVAAETGNKRARAGRDDKQRESDNSSAGYSDTGWGRRLAPRRAEIGLLWRARTENATIGIKFVRVPSQDAAGSPRQEVFPCRRRRDGELSSFRYSAARSNHQRQTMASSVTSQLAETRLKMN